MTYINNKDIIYLERYLNIKGGNDMGMSETLKAISDPVRRDILEMIKYEKKFRKL